MTRSQGAKTKQTGDEEEDEVVAREREREREREKVRKKVIAPFFILLKTRQLVPRQSAE
jgi:hypothetical protein